ncbi:MAG: OadG family protein [Thermotogaceae bacterium]|nr:OadG family protein [Thermotogaceae bacterium]
MTTLSFTLTGLTVVFFVFAILFTIFRLMSLLSKQRKIAPPSRKEARPVAVEGEIPAEHVAIISAVLGTFFKNEEFVVERRRKERRTFSTWRTSGWKGARKWRASSKW